MPQKTSPFLEGKWGWNLGEGGWNSGADENWLKFSYMFDANVDAIVSTLPTAVNGEAYFLTTDNRIYFVVDGSYYSTPVPKWFEFKIKSTGVVYRFTGITTEIVPNPLVLEPRVQALEDLVPLKVDAIDLASSTGSQSVGYLNRTQHNKNSDIISVRDYITTAIDGVTSNQAGIVAALSEAVSRGSDLYWPAGTYVSDANIPNFHSIHHTGPGILKKGSTLFRISIRSGEINNIYVSTAGVIGNDGLSSTTPMPTVQAGLNALTGFGPVLDGIWRVNLAAGTYPEQVTFPPFLRGRERISIVGPTAGTPNVPTAIMEGGGSFSFGIVCPAGSNIIIQDIKFQNYLDFGVNCADFCDLYMINAHFESITGGRGLGFHFQQGRLRVYGGKANNCGVAGGSVISQTTISIGSLTNNLAGGFQVTNCPVGIACQESVTGHIDYATITGGVTGIDIVITGRVNSTGCVITGQTKECIWPRLTSLWLDSGGNTLTPGVGGVRIRGQFGSGEINELNTAVQERRVIFDSTTASLTGTTTSTQIKNYVGVIDADSFDWDGRKVRVAIKGKFDGGAGTKTITCRLGGNLIFGLVSIVSSTGFFRFDGELNAVSPTSQRYSAFMLDTTVQNAPVTPCKGDVGSRAYSLNTGSDLNFEIYGQLSNSADTITINTVEIFETA